ncbi:MAG: endopeptidase La [Proteobacteria bacterium]|nr:endopeptidase La [Pseudomonadota bacterium]NBP14376.1 endopeptidase La [bacterium]
MNKEKELLEEHSVTPAISEEDSNFLALLPLKNVVLLPKSILPIIVGRPSSIRSVEYALKHNKIIFISAQKDPNVEQPTQDDIYQYGTRATILQVMRMPNGSLKILVEGIGRARILESDTTQDFTCVHIEDLPTQQPKKITEQEAGWRTLKDLYLTYSKLNEKAPQDLFGTEKTTEDIDYIVDTIAVHLNLSFDERQKVLEAIALKERMMIISMFLKKEIEILEIEQRIKGHIQTQVEKNQREYYLTEQIKAIHKELGREDQQTEFAQLKETIIALKPPQDVLDKVDKELKRLEQMPPLSSEAVVSRHYVDWIASLPWSKASKDRISLTQAENILNTHHAGLKKVKERIIEFLAAKKFAKTLERSPIICLAGPPGVGKTSLAKSIAESLGRTFVRISLGGIKDEAEIRGHRRTYIGALPGKIIQAMRKAKTINPVILLDEIDKMSMDVHGDPASALLEVLDPEQNKTFVDHFLDAEYDLSKVMFITTANHIESIPYPLFDRMEVINLSGYTNQEKLMIAKKFLFSKNLEEYGLTPAQFKISDELLETLIAHYTKEAGVRQLERLIAKIMRKAIQVLLKEKTKKSITVTAELLREWLGHAPYKQTKLEQEEQVGLATGLAWTELGGDVLEIEVTILQGKGSFTLTGQLGDVMQESGHAALSYIRSRVADLGIPKNFYSTKDLHIHLPEGATPKDGPSAGITMCTAIVSALTKNPVLPHIAMTGEITLRGRVLGVGGLKEKLLAAKQHGIKTALVPYDNKDDVEEILKETNLDITIHYVKNMDEVLKIALKTSPFVTPITAYKKIATKKRK